ncbi:alpha/beta hydrolase [Intrasporangium sp.]|uniref:alpha/beta fold hydrolase n=1 Tax=Intrasporangium sp. TaxID=1925024 RepID=UPI00293A80A2|nr:alpha/beta hydrolase [Intrasporangium sp.]MDV3221250.1 alpha/beta hydrolase [Intrasporangium sp.]
MDRTETTTTHVVLVAGHWLGGWAWDAVAGRLAQHGHHVEAVTLPGTSPGESHTNLTDQITALELVVERAPEPPVVVAHSGAGRVVTGVLDRHPRAVRRVVYVDSGPAADGSVFDETVAEDVESIELPTWAELSAGGASLEGLSEQDLATFRERAVPVPAAVARERLHLRDDARLTVPTTIIATSLPSDVMMGLAQQGHPMFAEVSRLTDLELIDLPTGHWPMWSRPHDLAEAINAAARSESGHRAAEPSV